MEIKSRRQHTTVVSFSRDFDYAGHEGWGFGFPCDERGEVLLSNPAAVANYRACLAGSIDGRAVVDRGIVRHEERRTVPAVGVCNRCRRDVTLDGFTNTCECGADYNGSGQELAPRAQWGEETGETVADILSVDRVRR